MSTARLASPNAYALPQMSESKKRAARIPPPKRKPRAGSAAPLPAALRPADPADEPPPAPTVPRLNVLADAESASTMERPRPELPEALHTMMLSASDLETYLGNGTLALSATDLETLHTRGLSVADVLAAVRSQQHSAEFSPVRAARPARSTGASARRGGYGAAVALQRAMRSTGQWVRGLFVRRRRVQPLSLDEPQSALPPSAGATAAGAAPGEQGRAATEEDHVELRLLACDLQAYLDGVETAGVKPRVLLRDGRVVGVILER